MSGSAKTTYHLRRGWRLWAALCLGVGVVGFLLLIAMFVALNANEAATSDEVGPLVCCLTPLASIALFLLIRYAVNLLATRLVISARGVEYHERRVHIRASWRDVQSLCVVKWHRRWLVDGLWLRQQNATPTPAIPVALFDAEWPQGTIAATLQQRAPHLFAPAGTLPPPPRRRRRRKAAPVAPPTDLGDTRLIPPQPVYNRAQPDPPADPPGTGVDTIRF